MESNNDINNNVNGNNDINNNVNDNTSNCIDIAVFRTKWWNKKHLMLWVIIATIVGIGAYVEYNVIQTAYEQGYRAAQWWRFW